MCYNGPTIRPEQRTVTKLVAEDVFLEPGPSEAAAGPGRPVVFSPAGPARWATSIVIFWYAPGTVRIQLNPYLGRVSSYN